MSEMIEDGINLTVSDSIWNNFSRILHKNIQNICHIFYIFLNQK